MIPGEYYLREDEITLCANRTPISMSVANTGDRPIQVGSHYHFYETNNALEFNRKLAYGYRLAIPSGSAIRFEPGQIRDIHLIPFSGLRRVYGFRADVMGSLDQDDTPDLGAK